MIKVTDAYALGIDLSSFYIIRYSPMPMNCILVDDVFPTVLR